MNDQISYSSGKVIKPAYEVKKMFGINVLALLFSLVPLSLICTRSCGISPCCGVVVAALNGWHFGGGGISLRPAIATDTLPPGVIVPH